MSVDLSALDPEEEKKLMLENPEFKKSFVDVSLLMATEKNKTSYLSGMNSGMLPSLDGPVEIEKGKQLLEAYIKQLDRSSILENKEQTKKVLETHLRSRFGLFAGSTPKEDKSANEATPSDPSKTRTPKGFGK